MKKNLLTIGLLATGLSVQAQNVLLHVDDRARMYVSEGTLVYNGGGLQSRGDGVIDLHGNMMVVGATGDGIKTIATTGASGTTITPAPTNVILRINNPSTPLSSTYGQLYIKDIPQGNMTSANVSKEYAATKHGAYQQIGIPFNGKTFSSFSTELGGNFNNLRWQGREILKWDNVNLRWDGSTVPSSQITSASTPGITILTTSSTSPADRTAYYTFGSADMNSALLHTLTGVPFADGIKDANRISLAPPASPIAFGTGGNNYNLYREKYNTYIYDTFDNSNPWNTSTTFGRYTYQLSNPYLTNLDLSMIGFLEAGGTTDNNSFGNVWGIVVDPTSVNYTSTTGTTSSYASSQMVTFDSNNRPVGNLPAALVIKPLGTFKIKLRTSASQLMDFDNLRRFSGVSRIEGTEYAVTAKNNSAAIKQLGVLALDANGNQIGETYYVVAPHFTTGNILDPSISSVQAMTTPSAIIQTFEETGIGGIDQNYSSIYRLYINEANETNYLGKRIDMNVYGNNIASLKFELRDNGILAANNTHALSSGTGFYYTVASGQAVQIKQGDVIPVSNTNYGLYYGSPMATLNTGEIKPKSRTLITYNPDVHNYIVRFDPDWKSSSIEVYDASGKLVISEKFVKTNNDYVIKLDSTQKAVYVVKVVGNDGTIVNSKILIK